MSRTLHFVVALLTLLAIECVRTSGAPSVLLLIAMLVLLVIWSTTNDVFYWLFHTDRWPFRETRHGGDDPPGSPPPAGSPVRSGGSAGPRSLRAQAKPPTE